MEIKSVKCLCEESDLTDEYRSSKMFEQQLKSISVCLTASVLTHKLCVCVPAIVSIKDSLTSVDADMMVGEAQASKLDPCVLYFNVTMMFLSVVIKLVSDL